MTLRIKEIREKLGLNQKDFAKSLGIKPTTFNGYETGMHDPKSEILVQIAKMYSVSVDYLLGISDEMFLCDSDSDNSKIQLTHPLLTIYENLNKEGQNKLMGFAEDLAALPKYKKGAEFSEKDHVG